jgi:GH18 family chitinase
MKQILSLFAAGLILSGCANTTVMAAKPEPYRAIAYVTVPASENWRWIGEDGDTVTSGVDTRYVTHVNFAFGMLESYQFDAAKPGRPLMAGEVASPEAYKNPADGRYHYRATVKGWIEEMDAVVDGDKYLRALVDLKKQKSSLKVLLSIGGWDSDGFSYMAATPEGRGEFIESCIELIHEYGLDGIDLDWDYPTNGGYGASAHSPDDVANARALLLEFRAALDKAFPESHKLLTVASGGGDAWVDAGTFPALDYMNVMCYDFDPGSGGPQADLAQAAVFMENHARMVGDTPQNRRKINLGIPFYNEGGPYLVPYYKGWNGHVDASPAITAEKMEWVKEQGYGGAFYWAYSMDVFPQDVQNPDDPEVKVLQRTVYEGLNG